MQHLATPYRHDISVRLSFARCAAALLALSATCSAQTWTQVQTQNSPSARWEFGMSYDPIFGRSVLFGGRDAANAFLADTWEYDGKNWAQQSPTTSPPGRYLTEMVFVNSRLSSLIFGGLGTGSAYLNDTWEWSGLTKAWTRMTPTTNPPGRYNPAMAYDSARDRVVMFGGYGGGSGYLNDTWEWDGKDWTRINTTNAPAARYTDMTYDAARKVVVLYGGSTTTYDTWEYDGKNWTQRSPANRPSARCCVAIEYDSHRQRVVVFGGYSPNNNETWEYDGTNWKQLTTTGAPSARRDFDNMVYDTQRKRMVLFGGYTNSGVIGDTWEFVATTPLTATPATIAVSTGGTQNFTLDAGAGNASRNYWLFGSVTGTSPGVTLPSGVGPVTIPLVPDPYTDFTIIFANSPNFVRFRGSLDSSGQGTAALVVPIITDPNAIGLSLYHAYLVYDASNNYYLASNAVELKLVR